MNPITQRRLYQFKANKRGYYSFLIFVGIFLVTLCAEFIANEKPLLVSYKGSYYFPVLKNYPETTFGGTFETTTNYRDPFVQNLIKPNGFIIWAPIPFSINTVNYALNSTAPSPPTFDNLLGTDDQGRDVLTRSLYGFRISILFVLIIFKKIITLGNIVFEFFYTRDLP